MSGVHGSMNSHTLYWQNGFKLSINLNNSDNIDMNADLKNGDVSGLIKSHTLSQFNESIYYNNIYWGVENGDNIGGHCFMNSHTIS